MDKVESPRIGVTAEEFQNYYAARRTPYLTPSEKRIQTIQANLKFAGFCTYKMGAMSHKALLKLTKEAEARIALLEKEVRRELYCFRVEVDY